MRKTTAHIINHTHWDREWFLTSVYTSRWIPGLIDKLIELIKENPDFHYLFDGQTLVIEDLLTVAPSYADKVRPLITQNQLIVGPYYCQPDWQLTSGELLIRNLMYGRSDLQKHGGQMEVGWLVDTFGHISQSPQIHQMFGLDAVYVWRGVPRLEPYFQWRGADGSQLLAVDLFGGYRNLYGVTHAPEVALKRLESEVEKLRPFYPTPDIPLFDGYDLEDNPEDPLTYFAQSGQANPDIVLKEATPASFIQTIAEKNLTLPTINGELNSGKFGATFPGVYSARTYLKIMARECEQLLFQLVEPLAVMASLHGRPFPAAASEALGRQLLQNAVHDCICGVSIDQVHEKMTAIYEQVFAEMTAEANDALTALLADFAAGDYVVSTNPLAEPGWQVLADKVVWSAAQGAGIWPIEEQLETERLDEPTTNFSWQNEHYAASVTAGGQVQIGDQRFGRFQVWAEEGDTYSTELGPLLGELQPITPLTLIEKSEKHAVLSFLGAWHNDEARVTAAIRLQFDQSPLVRWQIDLDSRGANLRVELLFETGQPGTVFAGMPFDVVQRSFMDTDLLPRDLPPELRKVLLGQRELGSVTSFPFHDFVALSGDSSCTAVLAKGLHAYTASEIGTLSLTLRRSVEWLTKADLRDRIGDAGPFFYVPDGRCERIVCHEVAVTVGDFAPDSLTLQRLNAAYQNPPLVVHNQNAGSQTTWHFLQESLPLSSLTIHNDQVLARFYNPTSSAQKFSQPYPVTDVWGAELAQATVAPAKKIVTVKLPHRLPAPNKANGSHITWKNPPAWRVGENMGKPDTAVLDQLLTKIQEIESELASVKLKVAQSEGNERLRWQHRQYVLDRERVESELSHLLNSRKLSETGELLHNYLFEPDEKILAVGTALNRLRIKRRIFDYVITVL